MMHRWLAPRLVLPSVCEVTPALLDERGITGIILDADNTLVPRKDYKLEPEVAAWIETMQASGRKLCVLSNSQHVRRVAAMVAPYQMPAFSLARKPFGSGFRRAMKALGTTAEQTVMIGDQLLTDILGGNLAGMLTIFVPPMTGNDFVLYRVMRPVERRLLRRWRHKRVFEEPLGDH